MLEVMGCTLGWASYDYARDKDEERIFKVNESTSEATREARLARKEAEHEVEESYQTLENLLYGPGIAD